MQPHDTMLKITISLFICIAFVTAADEPAPYNSSTTSSISPTTSSVLETTALNNVPDLPKYLFKLTALIDDSKVPAYLTDLIRNEPSKSNITSDDILTLYGLKNISLEKFVNLLTNLNISASAVLSQVGFEIFMNELGLDFSTIYRDLSDKLILTSSDKITFLDYLGVDARTLIIEVEFGNSSYEIFKRGNLSSEAFINAIGVINKTTEQFFEVVLANVVNGVIQRTPEEILGILKRYEKNMNKLSQLWNLVNVAPEVPHQIEDFEKLFMEMASKIDGYSPLGILTDMNQIITNKAVVDLFQAQPVKINAQYVGDNTTWNVSYKQNASWTDIMVLTVDNLQLLSNVSYAVLASDKIDLQNCVFFSINNGTLIYENVHTTQNNGDTLVFNSTIFKSYVPLGSPLVCDNKVYGLATNISTGIVTLNSFAMKDGSVFKPSTTVPGTIASGTPVSANSSNPSAVLRSSLLVLVFGLIQYFVHSY